MGMRCQIIALLLFATTAIAQTDSCVQRDSVISVLDSANRSQLKQISSLLTMLNFEQKRYSDLEMHKRETDSLRDERLLDSRMHLYGIESKLPEKIILGIFIGIATSIFTIAILHR
jgi:hypothetical protein